MTVRPDVRNAPIADLDRRKGFPPVARVSGAAMTTIHDDLGSLDDWLLQQGIEQAEREVSIENQLIPQTVKGLGQPHVYLYATLIFDGEVANGGLQQFFENASGALAPTVRDALREMALAPTRHS
jgi:hypothetical protein